MGPAYFLGSLFMIGSDVCLGVAVYLSNGTVDVIYQRADGSYYWKNIDLGVWAINVCPKANSLYNNTDNLAIGSEDSTPAESLLDDSA